MSSEERELMRGNGLGRRCWWYVVLSCVATCCGGVSTAATPPVAEGQASAPPLVVTPNEFTGTDVERINQAIKAAADAGCRVVIPRFNIQGDQRRELWLLDSAILLPSDTFVELDNCRIKLSDRCRDNFFRSANCGLGITDIRPLQNIHIRGIGRAVLEGADRPRATGDSGKTLGARSYGTDAGVAGESQTGDWRNIGILLAFVEHFSIQNLAIVDSHAWAISLERCAHGTLRDLDFASSEFKHIDGTRQTILNQDGIDLLWLPLRPKQGGQEGNESGNRYLDVDQVLSIWRESVPEELRAKWPVIDPPMEDRILDLTQLTGLIPRQGIDAPAAIPPAEEDQETPAAAVTSEAVAAGE